MIQSLAAKDVCAKKLASALVVDVRTPIEVAEVALTCPYVHVPVDTVQPADIMLRHGLDKGAKVMLICRSGKRARRAAEAFEAAGYTNLVVVEGGVPDLVEKGLAVSSQQTGSCETAAPTLERQIRIAAGGLLLLGLGLSYVHELFLILPWIVGCGLFFGGLINWCGMGLLLAKAPWNQVKPSCKGSCATGSVKKSSGGCS